MSDDLPLWFALTYLSGLTHSQLHDLIGRWCSDPARQVADLAVQSAGNWRAAGLTEADCRGVARAIGHLPAARCAVQEAAQAGLSAFTSRSAEYPPMLARSLGRGRPPLLFVEGSPALLTAPGVAMIGSRRPVAAALDFTRAAARAFGSRGLNVVSGFAEGVDRCASGAALDAGGTTLLVLAQGLLTLRPGGRALARGFPCFRGDLRALMRGIDAGRIAVLSPFPPRADWTTPQAMARNAVITALTRDVVVGQAGTSGGAWEAARMGLHQGKRVWVRRSAPEDGPLLGDGALEALGAHRVAWPSAEFEAWAQRAAETVWAEHAAPPCAPEWTEQAAAQLLRGGEPSEIHDASGLTGALLLKIVDGRASTPLRSLDDLRAIRGLGQAALQEVRRAFGLTEPGPQVEELDLFPDADEIVAKRRTRGAR